MAPTHSVKKYILFGIFVAILIGISFWLGIFVSKNEFAQEIVSDYGYLGAFLLAIASGFNFAVPIPAIAFLPIFAAAGLNVPVITFIITAGMTAGDLLGYTLGRASREVLSEDGRKREMSYFKKLQNKYHTAPLFALFIYTAFVPLPNELVIVPLGFMGYGLKYIVPITFAGNAIFNLIASTAFLGIFEQVV